MRRAVQEIWDLVQPIADSMNYEFVGAEYGQAENGMTLRVYIDGPQGVQVEDCAKVSRQLSASLDVEDLIREEYVLEVSSPGINRPLFSAEHYLAQVGSELKVKMSRSTEARRNYKGTLESVIDESLHLVVDGETFTLAIKDVEQARLVFKFD